MSQSILIKNVLLDSSRVDVLIQGKRFSKIAPAGTLNEVEQVIDGANFAILPPFYNTHTHAAMTLLRGYGADVPLKSWLEDFVWPRENSLTPPDIERGSRIAIREMIKSGTVFFCDMYFNIEETIKVAEEMGVRACIGVTFLSNHPLCERADKIRLIETWQDRADGRISLCTAPHAVYTASGDVIRKAHELAVARGMKMIIHLAETEVEVADCVRDNGLTPVMYLDSLGVLDEHILIAHAVHLTDGEIDLLARRGVVVAHCPCSNMKLHSGVFRYDDMIAAGVKVTLATDGAASNNNLDMREEMKIASLLAKSAGSPTSLPTKTVFDWATRCGAEAFGIDAGVIAEGKLADALLVRMDDERMIPEENLLNNWVYSAQSDLIDTVICDGRILMAGRKLLV